MLNLGEIKACRAIISLFHFIFTDPTEKVGKHPEEAVSIPVEKSKPIALEHLETNGIEQ
jgi:hypothetical protein